MPIKKNHQNRIYCLIVLLVMIWPIKNTSGVDCDQQIAEAKRLYSMAQEQLELNPKAAEAFLLQALEGLSDCEYTDNLKQELASALGQLYYREGDWDKAIQYLEDAIELGMNIESPNPYPAVLLGNICAEKAKTEAIFFPKALLNYKRALEINNFSSTALAKQAEAEYKKLKAQATRMEAKLWEAARTNETEGEFEAAFKCYEALALLERSYGLTEDKGSFKLNIKLQRLKEALNK